MTFIFKHPKYYTELRKRNKLAESRQPVVGGQQQSDQAISGASATAPVQRATGPGLKLGEMDIASSKHQASSFKLQASSKPEPVQVQASSAKRQASQPE